MKATDRAYLDGLRDDLCERWGFTWHEVEQGERLRRMSDLSIRIAARTAEISTKMADFTKAVESFGAAALRGLGDEVNHG